MNTAIVAERLSKQFQLGQQSSKDLLVEVLARPWESQEKSAGGSTFQALTDVSFEISAGEAVGVVGHNGAGKSTLLKILSRIMQPTSGRFGLRGRVGSLLEVGTGFHTELTGRENVYLNGTILGMRRKEIDKNFDAIVDFADVAEFLDTPVKRYSSGMQMRLAFAVSAFFEPEILIIDEVLAVGDARFQAKCFQKLSEVRDKGQTVLVVSHDLAAVRRVCQRVMVMDRGRIAFDGDSPAGIERYLSLMGTERPIWRQTDTAIAAAGFQRVELLRADGTSVTNPSSSETLAVEVEYYLPEPEAQLALIVVLSTEDGIPLFTTSPFDSGLALANVTGTHCLRVALPGPILLPQGYRVSVVLGSARGVLQSIDPAIAFRVEKASSVYDLTPTKRFGSLQMQCNWAHSLAAVRT